MNKIAAAKTESLTRQDWSLVLLLSAINITHILDFVIVMPLGDRLREELSIDPQQFGFIVASYGLAAMVTGIIAATVIDRFDRRHVMLTSLVGFTIATFFCGLATSYSNLILGRILAGGFGGVVASTVMAFIVDLIPPARRGKAIGVVSSSFAFASTIGLPVGLTLAQWFEDFHAPFLGIGIVAVLVTVYGYFMLPNLVGLSAATQQSPIRQFVLVARQPNHFWSFLFMFAMVTGTFMIVPYIAPYMVANSGLPRSYLPWMYGIGGVFTLGMVNLVGWMTDRFGARPMFLFTAGSAVAMTLVLTNLPDVSIFTNIALATCFMMVASSRIVPAQAMMLKSADPTTRGAFTSLNSAVTHLATGTAPIISGLVIDETVQNGPLTGFWLAGIFAATFGVAALILSYCLHEHKDSDLQAVGLQAKQSMSPQANTPSLSSPAEDASSSIQGDSIRREITEPPTAERSVEKTPAPEVVKTKTGEAETGEAETGEPTATT